MDTFTFMIAIILMMLAIQFNEQWLAFSIIAIMILTMRSISATVILVFAMGVLYFMRGNLEPYWPFIFFGLIIVALIFGMKGAGGGDVGGQPEYYSPDMYSGLMGGGG